MLPRVAVLLVTLMLAGCAAPQASFYAPLSRSGGYAERELGRGLFQVTFQGNAATSRERAETFALYRAAELTVQLGAERFAVHDRLTERDVRVTREYYDPFPYGPFWHHRRPFHYGMRTPHSFQYERTTYRAELTVEIFTGIAPGDVGRVYRAREVLQRLAPQIVRPPEGTQ
jgi:hypothetical protein